ncbi:MAG: cadherin-like domain-containing protein [Candidatus Promineifilaceae bacterium]|nr:cadherin-like domain-containing protein [Candidatus Promineifilaceae bacterium]
MMKRVAPFLLAGVLLGALLGLMTAGVAGSIPAMPAAETPVGCSTGELIAAINAANGTVLTDTLVLAGGCTYTLTAVDNQGVGPNGLPLISSAIVISGNGATIARDPAAPAMRLLQVGPTGDLTLHDLTLRGGLLAIDQLRGGAIYNQGQLAVHNAMLTGNSSADWDGGALGLAPSSHTLISDTVVMSNTADVDGGGFFAELNGDGVGAEVIVQSSTFMGNVAVRGGAYFADGTVLMVADSQFLENRAFLGGAGYQLNGTIVMTDVTFAGNLTGDGGGGGAVNGDGDVTRISNGIFSATGGDFGGAFLLTENSVYSLTNVAVVSNTADFGGAFSNFDSSLWLVNSIVWSNTVAVQNPVIDNFGLTNYIGHSIIQGSGGSGAGWDDSLGTDGGGNLDADPQFLRAPDPAAGDYGDFHIPADSPAVDAGTNDPPGLIVLPAADLDGQPRRENVPATPDTGTGSPPLVDMGPYEVQNAAPLARPDDYAVLEDQVLLVDVAAEGLLANDEDPDGDPLTAVLVTGPSSGTLDLNDDGTFRYAPAAEVSGVDHFFYRATDGAEFSAPMTVTVVITAVNDVPVAVPDSYEGVPDAPLLVAAPGVLANDRDPDGPQLQAVLIEDVNEGQLTLAPDGSFVYTPTAGFGGIAIFQYAIDDGLVQSDPAVVTITYSRALYLPFVVKP